MSWRGVAVGAVGRASGDQAEGEWDRRTDGCCIVIWTLCHAACIWRVPVYQVDSNKGWWHVSLHRTLPTDVYGLAATRCWPPSSESNVTSETRIWVGESGRQRALMLLLKGRWLCEEEQMMSELPILKIGGISTPAIYCLASRGLSEGFFFYWTKCKSWPPVS